MTLLTSKEGHLCKSVLILENLFIVVYLHCNASIVLTCHAAGYEFCNLSFKSFQVSIRCFLTLKKCKFEYFHIRQLFHVLSIFIL